MVSTIFQESLKNNQKFRSHRSILRFSVRVRVVLPSSFVVSNELRSKNPIEIDDFREVSNAFLPSPRLPSPPLASPPLPSPPLPSPSSHLESYSADGTNPRITLFYLCYENQPFALTSVCIFSLLFYLHFLLNFKENLSTNQELLELAIISPIIITLMFDPGVILLEKLNAYHS